MLVVRAEIWPGGDETRALVIGEITAANISNLAEVSSYSVKIDQTGHTSTGVEQWDRTFVLSGHARRRGVWELVRRITSQCLGERFVEDQHQ